MRLLLWIYLRYGLDKEWMNVSTIEDIKNWEPLEYEEEEDF